MSAAAHLGRQRHEPEFGGIEARELVQRYIVQGAPYGGVDALPAAADAALALYAATAGGAAAFRDGDRALEHVENLRRGDASGRRARR